MTRRGETEGAPSLRTPTESTGADAAGGAAASQIILALACAAQFMVVLDVSVVNVALPSIRASLGFDPVSLQWVASAYALAFAGSLLLGGRLADLYGRRQVFVAGLALFSTASLIGGLAGVSGVLVSARAFQGLGAAVLAPATLTILTTTFPEGHKRTRALAVWSAVSLAGGATGNLIGGVLTQYLSWRWILLVNVPIGAAAILLAIRFLTGGHELRSGGQLDVPGAALATVGLASLTYGVTQTRTQGWSSPVTVGILAVGIVALAVLVLVETRFSSAPLIPLGVLRRRAIWMGNVMMLLAGAAFQIPMWYFLTLYMQNVLHYGAVQTGLGFLPHTVLTLIVGLRLTPWLMKYVDHRTLITVGGLIATAGFLWQSRITPDSSYLSGIAGPAILTSAGVGLLNIPITTVVTSGVSTSDAGAASGLMNTTKQFGGALGLAVLIAIAASDSTSSPQAATAGYGRVFLATAAILAVVSVLARALPARPDPTPTPISDQLADSDH